MANTDPVTDTAEAAEYLADLARRTAAAEVIVVGAVTKGLAGEELSELGLMNASAAGVTMFSDDGRCVMDSLLMRRALTYVKTFGGVIAQHAQDARLAGPGACCHESEISGRLGLPGWPAVAESVIVARDVQIAEMCQSRIHVCHVSTAESVEVIRWAKGRGIQVTAEVTPHHLYLGTREVEGYDTTFKVNPPLRTDEHIEAIRQALADGTIDMVGTDHAPHASEDKDHPFDVALPGMLGLEQSLAVVMELMVNTGRMDWPTLVQRMSTAPAALSGSRSQGRPIAIGEPANLVLLDPSARAVVDRESSASRSRNNPYHGRDLPDPVVATVWAGRITHRR
jgi:dihydroorotase